LFVYYDAFGCVEFVLVRLDFRFGARVGLLFCTLVCFGFVWLFWVVLVGCYSAVFVRLLVLWLCGGLFCFRFFFVLLIVRSL